MTLIYILIGISLALNVYLYLMFNGLKQLIEESGSGIKYEYTKNGIVFYDKTGKQTLIKGESL